MALETIINKGKICVKFSSMLAQKYPGFDPREIDSRMPSNKSSLINRLDYEIKVSEKTGVPFPSDHSNGLGWYPEK